MATGMTGDDFIRILGLIPHIEGGHYREIYRDNPADGSRGIVTSIYYLLQAGVTGERSHWHRFDAPEIMCYHGGAPLEVAIWTEGRPVEKHRIGSDLLAGEKLQLIVPAGAWRAAEPLGDWSIVGCQVAPAFQWDSFEMEPDDWSPAGRMAEGSY